MRADDGSPPAADHSEITWWPDEQLAARDKVTIGTVSYNTRDLVAFLVWSIYRHIGLRVGQVVVVDNGSTDGSRELISACEEAGLCTLIANGENRYHGPGLNQIVSFLAQEGGSGAEVERLWLLDSDCVIARADVVTDVVAHARRQGAVLIGEPRWNRWHGEERLGTYSLLLDPARLWRPPTLPFVDDGDPAREFELSCRAQGLTIASFPFAAEGYLIHRGRGTLARVKEQAESSNRFRDWAETHHEAHYEDVDAAAVRYRALWSEFLDVVGPLTPERLVAAIEAAQADRANALAWPPAHVGNGHPVDPEPDPGIETNRTAWDLAARKYVEESAELLAQADTTPALVPAELELLEPVLAERAVVVHLQSGHGLDDLELARRFAATVIGVDFSAVTAEAARNRARQLDLDVRYVVAKATRTGLRTGIADVVYSGKGAVMWQSDLGLWGIEIARLLRRGGHFVLYDAHPAASLWTRDPDIARINSRRRYFDDRRTNDSFPASAIQRFDPRGTVEAVEWQWTIADIVNALISAGLSIMHLGEHPEPFWQPTGEVAAAWNGALPNSFSLLARAQG